MKDLKHKLELSNSLEQQCNILINVLKNNLQKEYKSIGYLIDDLQRMYVPYALEVVKILGSENILFVNEDDSIVLDIGYLRGNDLREMIETIRQKQGTKEYKGAFTISNHIINKHMRQEARIKILDELESIDVTYELTDAVLVQMLRDRGYEVTATKTIEL